MELCVGYHALLVALSAASSFLSFAAASRVCLGSAGRYDLRYVGVVVG
jgi:hypothetical protein